MAKQVEADSCPTCGHAPGGRTVFKVAEFPVVDAEPLNALREDLSALTGAVGKESSLPADALAALNSAGVAARNMEAAATALNETREQVANTVPAPSIGLLEHWNECDDCKPKWDEVKLQIAEEARKGYITEDEAKALATEIAQSVAQRS